MCGSMILWCCDAFTNCVVELKFIKMKVGFIGAGKMAEALCRGFISSGKNVFFSCRLCSFSVKN